MNLSTLNIKLQKILTINKASTTNRTKSEKVQPTYYPTVYSKIKKGTTIHKL